MFSSGGGTDISDLFWFSDEQWARIQPMPPKNTRGLKRVDDRRVLSGIVHVLKSGGRWADCPADYGPKKTIYNRFVRWPDFRCRSQGCDVLYYRGHELKREGSAMPTRIYLVRHGATQLTEEDRFAGSADVNLSEEGRKKVASLSERLKDDKLDAIYSSPLVRTLETARILAAPHGLEPVSEQALREIDYGRWEKMRRVDVERDFAEEYAIWQEDPFTIAPQDGESGLNVLNRILPVVRRIVETHRHKSVLLVSHKGTNRLLISRSYSRKLVTA